MMKVFAVLERGRYGKRALEISKCRSPYHHFDFGSSSPLENERAAKESSSLPHCRDTDMLLGPCVCPSAKHPPHVHPTFALSRRKAQSRR